MVEDVEKARPVAQSGLFNRFSDLVLGPCHVDAGNELGIEEDGGHVQVGKMEDLLEELYLLDLSALPHWNC